MMQDTFHEQLVVRKKTGVDYLIQAGAILLATLSIPASLLLSLNFQVFSMLAPFLMAAAIYGAYKLIVSRNIEYEYIVTNGEIDIDKIVNRAKRKRVVTFQATRIDDIGYYKPEENTGKKFGKVYDFTENKYNLQKTIFINYPSKDNGMVQILISLNDNLLGAIRRYLPTMLQRKIAKSESEK